MSFIVSIFFFFQLQDSSSDFVASQSILLKGDAEEIYHSCTNKPENGKDEAEENHFDFVRMKSHLIEDKSHPHHKKSTNGKKEEVQAKGDVLKIVETEDDPLVRDTGRTSEADDKKQKAVLEDLPHKAVQKHKEEQYKGTDESYNPAM